MCALSHGSWRAGDRRLGLRFWLAEYVKMLDLRLGVVRFLNDARCSRALDPRRWLFFVGELLVAPFHGFSGFAGSVALGLLAVPVITRTTEDVLLPGAVPDSRACCSRLSAVTSSH